MTSSPHATLLSLIRKISSLFWEVSFIYTLLEGNECSDWLTKFDVTNMSTP